MLGSVSGLRFFEADTKMMVRVSVQGPGPGLGISVR